MGEENKQSASGAATDPGRRRAFNQASGVLLVVIVAMVNYLAYRHYERIDLTTEGIFTLSPKSQEVIAGLDEDIDVYVFLSQGEPAFQRVDELLKRYQVVSDRVHVHYVDPDREPAEFKVQAQRFGVMTAALESGQALASVAAVVAKGDKNWHVSRDDLVGFDIPIPGQKETTVKAQAEMALTGAVVQVTSGRATKVCVAQGHGEWSLEPSNEGSLAGLQQVLQHDNIEWQPLSTMGLSAVPEDCDAVFVVSPSRAYSDTEAALLDDYLRSGGNLLLALDPVIEHDEIRPSGLESMLQKHGVRLDQALVVELSEDRLLTGSPVDFVVTEFNAHETTTALQGMGAIFMTLVRGVTPDGSQPEVTTLLRTSEKGYGETNLAGIRDVAPERQADDLQGPVSLAIATRVQRAGGDSDEDTTGGRMIVVGDSDFMVPDFLGSPELANAYLAAAWTGWLTERKALIAVPPKKLRGGSVVLTQDDLSALFLRVAVLLPAFALFAGVGAWLNRRA